MAKSGVASRVDPDQGGSRSAATKESLIQAAIETLKTDGYAGASARVIAGRAGCNQALVFYHFGSVARLLLAALDAVSDARASRYRGAVGEAATPQQLVEVAGEIFREDLDAGYVTVLVAMIAGASSDPELRPAVAARLLPWRSFARDAISGMLEGTGLTSLLPADGVAHLVVALYLGLELLAHLDGDRDPAADLFARAHTLISVLGSVVPGSRDGSQ